MKTLLIVTLPTMIVATVICSVHFFNLNYQVTSFVLYLAFWSALSLWITAVSAKKEELG